jgi:hypothetical protein
MPQLVLENFAEQFLSTPKDVRKHPNYLISGTVPYYSKKQQAFLDPQYAPLAATPKPTSVRTGLDGNIVRLIPSPDNNAEVYGITDKVHVYKFGSFLDLTAPFGSISNNGGFLAVFNGDLLATYTNGGSVQKAQIPSFAWSSFGTLQTASGIHYLEPFLDFCAIVDGDASFQYGHFIKKITSSFTITTGIDIGAGWGVVAPMRNYNNKYLIIPAGYQGGSSFGSNYLFLWDGIADRYQYAVQVPGIYIDGIMGEGGVFYCVVQTSQFNYTFYYLSGLTLKPLFDFSYSNVTAMGKVDGNIAALTGAGVLVFDESDPFNFFFDPGSSYAGIAAGGQNNTTYLGQATSVLTLPTASGSGLSPYNIINYKSQFLEPKETHGQVNWVKVYYDTPPSVTGDQIALTLNAVDNNAPAGSGANNSVALDLITSATAGSKYQILDGKGLTFNKVQIALQTAYGGGSTWFPVIRKIVIDYQN